MALRDYYRCKRCDGKIAYGPDRPAEDWEPFLLCRACLAATEMELAMVNASMDMAVQRLGGTVEGRPTIRLNFLQRIDELIMLRD